MTKLNMHEAKTHLSKYVGKALQGEQIVLCKNGEALAEIIPLRSKKKDPKKRIWGSAKGKIKILDSFFDDLTDDEFPGIGLPKKTKKS